MPVLAVPLGPFSSVEYRVPDVPRACFTQHVELDTKSYPFGCSVLLYASMEDATSDRLNFFRFDISRLLKHGASLLGSAGAEFEVQDDKSGEIDPKERLARQRKLLQKKLGLDMGAAIGMDTEDLFNDEDLDYTPSPSLVVKQSMMQAAELIDSEFRPGMSNRQKNKAKRMAKLVAKQRSRDVDSNDKSNDSFEGEPEEKRRKTTNVVIEQPATESKVLIDNIPDNSCLHDEMKQQHQEWLEDLVIRLLCVFALDRFGDFVSDEVVAPVRETCAQTLGVALRHMSEAGVEKAVDVLLKLLTQEQWEVRHGGLLGIKYALAVRKDMIKSLLPKVLPAVTEGLQDLDDDVRAVAAASLIPVVEGLVQLQADKEKSSGKTRQGSNQVKEVIQEYIAGADTVTEDFTTRDYYVMRARMMAAKLLGALCCCICDPEVNAMNQDIRPSESLAQLLLFHLNSKSALQRIAVALLLCEWAALQKVTSIFNEFTTDLNIKSKTLQHLESKRQQVQITVTETNQEWQILHLRVHMFTACAIVNLQLLPDKLNPVIKPLMEATKKEENTLVQSYAATFIAKLLQQCILRSPCPNPKIIKNLCSSVCIDPLVTPSAACPVPDPIIQENSKGVNYEKDGVHHTVNKTKGIITLYRHQKAAFAITSRRGPTPKAVKNAAGEHPAGSSFSGDVDESKKPCLVQRRGAEFALTTVTKHFGLRLTPDLPYLWDSMVGPLKSSVDPQKFDRQALVEKGDSAAQDLVNSLQVLEITAGSMASELHPQLLERLPHLCMCLQHPYTGVRHMAARCVGILSKIATTETMNIFLEKILPWLGAINDNTKQEGAIEAMACVIEQLDVDIVPYIVLLVVPVLGRMSDQTDSVRFMATQCFATLIRLMPLEAGIPDPPHMSEDLVRQKARERHFLEQLLDGRKLENYKIPVPIKAELRKYQQDGVNWLSFLNKYKLHGILCDDMGLGKTLQSICILAGDHYLRAQEYAKSKAADCSPLPSLVVCPPTLTGHWVDEVGKFCSREYLNPLHYTGPPTERARLQHQVKKHNLVVASYDVVRNDIDFFSNIKFNYCILDEGHVIKNGKTKLSKAVKQLTANYRVILSGTPIQIQLYEDFAKSRAKVTVDETISTVSLSEEVEKPKLKAAGHVFQALQYLRKLCNHPALVLTPVHPEYKRIAEQLTAQRTTLQDIQHAPKLSALKQLLMDCGLGNGGATEGGTEAVVAQHRVLIFCQLKSMLDIVEHDLLKPHLPTVTYLRLDGSVQAGQRHSIVARFNNDPSIDVLLLTTHVGGLGLNLTGADTVVFVEHDWNPMRDLQAMDRAHRIGQKRVVNVYRLITRGTLEEKIMGLQKFKMSIANTIISQENASLQSMGTDQLLNLFTLDKGKTEEKAETPGTSGKASMKSILDNLGDLWSQEQYDAEYNLDTFIHSLK
ncbi:BTAF1 factor, partial [Polypterus senegalus]